MEDIFHQREVGGEGVKKIKSEISKRSLALLVAAAMFLGAGTFAAAKTVFAIQSEYYRAHFYLNHLQVHLIENGKDVCKRAGHENNLDSGSKVTGELATSLGYKHQDGSSEKLGSIEPGKLYQEEIAAQNGSDIDEFVRLTVRKYWMEVRKDDEGNVITDENGDPVLVKSSKLKPSRIHLYYNGKEGYNSSAWTLNKREQTAESSTYYYKTDLDPDDTSALLFDKVSIDKDIIDLGEVKESTETLSDGQTTKTIYKYSYQYDDCVFFIEADVQAIQTHNIDDAIKSQWGVSNVTAVYDDATSSGSLTVN